MKKRTSQKPRIEKESPVRNVKKKRTVATKCPRRGPRLVATRDREHLAVPGGDTRVHRVTFLRRAGGKEGMGAFQVPLQKGAFKRVVKGWRAEVTYDPLSED